MRLSRFSSKLSPLQSDASRLCVQYVKMQLHWRSKPCMKENNKKRANQHHDVIRSPIPMRKIIGSTHRQEKKNLRRHERGGKVQAAKKHAQKGQGRTDGREDPTVTRIAHRSRTAPDPEGGHRPGLGPRGPVTRAGATPPDTARRIHHPARAQLRPMGSHEPAPSSPAPSVPPPSPKSIRHATSPLLLPHALLLSSPQSSPAPPLSLAIFPGLSCGAAATTTFHRWYALLGLLLLSL